MNDSPRSDPSNERLETEPWFVPASAIEVPPEEGRWLVDGLLGSEGVAVIGGDPKLGKSWLVSHLAVAVASGLNCLDQFLVHDPGCVLVVSAEGPPWMATDRLQHVARHMGRDLASLPIQVMARRVPQLDGPADQNRPLREVERLKAKLLILDPLAQMHSADENSAQGLASVLNYINLVRRSTGASVVLVHHVRKGARGRGGSRLRGSSAIHAWLDSGLYLAARDEDAELTVEQRCGPSPDPMLLRLVTSGSHHHLEILDPDLQPSREADTPAALKSRILALLEENPDGQLPRHVMRGMLGVKNERLSEPLRQLEAEGQIARHARGIGLARK